MSELTIGEALRAIAERTPFRTEEERRDVLAAIDRESEEDARYAETLDDDGKTDATGDKPTPEQPAEPEQTPAEQTDKQPARSRRR